MSVRPGGGRAGPVVRLAAILVVGVLTAGCGRPASSQIVVPNLVGTQRAEATARLTAVGLRYQVAVQPLSVRTCLTYAGRVIAQRPPGGTPVLSWTVVTIVSYGAIPPGTVNGTACVPPP